jgi:putative ATP-dependent endonuclease of OLD family
VLIKKVKISNFRSIKHAEIELNKTTVLIGPNNAGKTALLEAIRIALTRRWGQRGTGFTEYDVHLNEERNDPKIGDPVIIEVEIQEQSAGEWPEDVQNELADLIQIDPITNLASIIMRVSCAWDVAEESYTPQWEFLNVERKPLTGKSARAVNFHDFFKYVPVFYLAALRDAGDEFSIRSQFWGKLLKTVQIPEKLEKRSQKIFDLLNAKLLKADPKLGVLSSGLSEISNIASSDSPGRADLRVLPLNTWDLISKAEVIYQSESKKPWLPLLRHGQGIQSLSVMFLLKSFIEQLLEEFYPEGSEAILALEEPETHLHPQAARSLWHHLNELPGQKIITTHSPYFLQHVPFRDLRVIRSGKTGTTVNFLPKEYRAQIPHIGDLDGIIGNSDGKLTYDRSLNELVCYGVMDQKTFRSALTVFAGRPDTASVHSSLKKLYEQSLTYINDEELAQLETFARRVRGEIFFARRWLLVEGPTEYNLMHGLANGLGYNFDENGVAVIDFQNNGNPDCFAALARALNFPWRILVDGDEAGIKYLELIKKRGFSDAEVKDRSTSLPTKDMEEELVTSGLQAELRQILRKIGLSELEINDTENLKVALRNNKSAYSAELAKLCSEDKELAKRMPYSMQDTICKLRVLE